MRNSLLFVASVSLLAGCGQDDEIVHYRVARVESAPVVRNDAAGKKEPVRFLAAIVPDKEQSWFLRLVGPEAAVTPLVETFEKFARSIRLTGKADTPITWDLPPGWQQLPGGTSARGGIQIKTHATIKIKSEPEDVEITVSQAGGSVLENVNRWRGQIRLDRLVAADLDKVAKTVDAGGLKVTVVDMVGTRFQQPIEGPMAPPRAPMAPDSAEFPKPILQIPTGWTETAPIGGFAVKQYEAGKGVQVTVTPFHGNGGGAALNINRWRDQIGLPKTTNNELLKIIEPLELAAGKALYVDMENPKGPGTPRVIGVMMPGEQHTWFIKMSGPGALVGAQKANFEAFAKSLRLEK